VIGAAILIFVPTTGDFVTPKLVGGTKGTMIANLIEGAVQRRGQLAAGRGAVPGQHGDGGGAGRPVRRRPHERLKGGTMKSKTNPSVYAFAYLAFLYVPVLVLPIFSFNDSQFIAFPCRALPPAGMRAWPPTPPCSTPWSTA
jgi:hypothetical protein